MQRLRHGARQLLPVDATVATVADAALDRSAAARDGVSLCGEDGATAARGCRLHCVAQPTGSRLELQQHLTRGSWRCVETTNLERLCAVTRGYARLQR